MPAPAINATTIVHYDGTNYGRIYLGNIGQRHQLGSGRGLYTHGQDRYMSYGQDATFTTTGDLLMDIQDTTHGRIGNFMKLGHRAFSITY